MCWIRLRTASLGLAGCLILLAALPAGAQDTAPTASVPVADRSLAGLRTAPRRALAEFEVEGVADLAAYARVSDYLSGLEGVPSVSLARVQAQRLEFQLDASEAYGLQQALSRSEVLELIPGSAGSRDLPSYRLRP